MFLRNCMQTSESLVSVVFSGGVKDLLSNELRFSGKNIQNRLKAHSELLNASLPFFSIRLKTAEQFSDKHLPILVSNTHTSANYPSTSGKHAHVSAKDPCIVGNTVHSSDKHTHISGKNPRISANHTRISAKNSRISGRNPHVSDLNSIVSINKSIN